MAAYTTYDQIGKAESVEDIIYDISPTDTPFLSLVKNEKVNARKFQWIEDALAAANADNKAAEGASASDATLTTPTVRENSCQILTKTINIAGTADAVKTYGRAKETAYQLGKALKEIKRDYEQAMVGVDNATVDAADGNAQAGTVREMDSISQMISTSVDAGGAATDALSEPKLLDLGATCYDNGSDPTIFMIKPADSRIVAGFSAASGRNREIQQATKLVNAIDLYVSPFGEYRVVLNRQMTTLGTHAYLIDPSMFRTCTLRPFSRTLLAKTGDNDRHFVVGEVSVKHNNYGDSGMITGLS